MVVVINIVDDYHVTIRAAKSEKTEEARTDSAVCGNRWQINHAAWIYAPLLPDPLFSHMVYSF